MEIGGGRPHLLNQQTLNENISYLLVEIFVG